MNIDDFFGDILFEEFRESVGLDEDFQPFRLENEQTDPFTITADDINAAFETAELEMYQTLGAIITVAAYTYILNHRNNLL